MSVDRCARALAAVAIVALSTLAPALASASPEAVAGPCAYAPAAVAVVVDFGDGSPVSAVCVPADSTDNAAELLAARAEQLGTPAPRFDAANGLLCAIDGVPSDGCGEQTGSQYAYWSYWHGTGSAWEYSNVGPGGSRVRADRVEGWRFQPHGAGNPSDPPPRGSADPASTCAAPVTTAPPPASSGDAGAPPSSAPLTADTQAGVGTTAAGDQTSISAPSSASATTTASGAPPTAGSERAAGGATVRDADGGGSSSGPLLGAGALVVALGVGGAVVARRRVAPP